MPHLVRRLALLIASPLLSAAALAQMAPAAPAGTPAAPATAPATAPTSQPAVTAEDVLATINGQPISQNQFYRELMVVAGPKLFEEVVSLTLAHQACAAAGISVTPEMVKAEAQRVYDNLEKQGVPKDKVQQAFLIVLQRQNVSVIEAQIGLERTACLRALGKGQGEPITDADLQQAFELKYGPKVEVRDIVVSTLADGAEISDLITKQGKTVDEVIAQHNLTSQLVTLAQNAPGLPATLTKTAFALKPGELSGVIPLTSNGVAAYHLLYKVRDLPAAEGVRLATVHDELKAELTQQRELQYAQGKLQQMMADARVQIRDPILGQLMQARMQQAQALRQGPAAPATQPALPAGPAPAPEAPLPGM